MGFCIRWLEEHDNDVESLKEELKRRGAYHIPLTISKAEEEAFVEKVKANCLDTILILSLISLRDEFQFGAQRLNRFKTAFNDYADSLTNDYVTWNDIIQALADECGLELGIRWNGKDPTAK